MDRGIPGPLWPLRSAVTVVLAVCAVGMGAGAIVPSVSAAAANPSGQLRAPRTSTTQDAHYLTDVAEADSDLVSYVNQYGNTALRGMLTDGLAFCAFLKRGGGIDTALVNEAFGARADEKTTHLPLSVHTFNTLESMALINLCPGETRLVPASVRAELRRLSAVLRSPARAP